MTHERGCDEAAAAVAAALRAGSPEVVSAAALAHLSGCPRCRAGLLLTLRELAARSGQAPNPAACAPCRAGLAGFLELEQADPAQARALYPQVWGHLWLCPACFDAYLSAQAFLAAEQEGELPPLALPAPSPLQRAGRLIRRILLTRRALSAALPLAGALRSSSSESFVVFDHSDGEPPRQLTVVVREQGAERWQMQVSVSPPVEAVLLVSIGAKSFAARFGGGVARIDDIPAYYVTDVDAPDMEIALLYPDEGGAP